MLDQRVGDRDAPNFLRLHYAPLRNEDQSIEGLICLVTDVTEHKREEQRLRKASQSDPLTLLLNRAGFMTQAQECLHDAAAKGEALNGKRMTEIYCKLLKDYHGDAAGVMQIDPVYCQEWAFIPHFYRDFYVYQYATSFTASEALASRVKSGDADALRRYLAFLAAGGSKYPIDLLRDAGRELKEHSLPAQYPAVLLDVPCSNTGVMRHRVDVKWRLQEGDFRKHARQQLDHRGRQCQRWSDDLRLEPR